MRSIVYFFTLIFITSSSIAQTYYDENGNIIGQDKNTSKYDISLNHENPVRDNTYTNTRSSCADPTANDVSRCGPGSVTLSASGSSGNYTWYDASSGGNILGTGSTYTTPNLNSTTTYYVDAFCGVFSDDFEDGNVVEYNNTANFSASTDVAHTGSYSGKGTSNCPGHYCDAYLSFSGITPTEVSFWVYATTSGASQGYFVLQDGTSGNTGTQLAFCYVYGGNTLRTVCSNSGSESFVDKTISLNTWHHVELKNINYSAQTFEVWYDGTSYGTYNFRGSASNIDRIFLYNYDAATAYYDDIDIGERSNRVSVDAVIVPPATANAGSDATVCEGNTYTVSGTASNYSGITWSTSGTGSFSNPNALSSTYTPSSADISNGSVTLTLTATGNSPCGNASDNMVLTITPTATANAGSDATICEGSTYTVSGAASNYSGITWSTNGTGTFDDPNILNATYTPSSNDVANGSITLTLTVHGNSPCGDATDDMILTINPQPTANAGNNDTICENDVYNLSGSATNYSGITWSTNGTGTFDDPNSLNATYTPSNDDIANGSITLTLTTHGNSPCGDATDNMILTINPQPTANAGNNDTICEGEIDTLSGSATNYSSVTWTTAGDGVFDDPSSLNAIYTPGTTDVSNGSVVLTLTTNDPAGPCNAASSTMTLIINPSPNVSANSDDIDNKICYGDTITLTGSGADSYTWDNGISNGIGFVPTTTQTYTVTGTTSAGCSNIDTIEIIVNSLPNIDSLVTTDVTVCSTPYNGSITAYVSGGSGGFNYSFNNGSFISQNHLDTLGAGVVTVTVVDTNGCQTSDSATIGTNNTLNIDTVYVTDVLCNGNSSGIITIVAPDANQFSIDNGATFDTSNTFTGLPAGNYNIMVLDSGNCQAFDAVTINEPTAIQLTSNVTNYACGQPGEASVQVTGGTSPYSYFWSTGDTASDITGLQPGTFYLTVTDAHNCFDSLTVIVGNDGGTAQIQTTSSDVSCNGFSDGTATAVMTNGSAPYVYQWNTGGSTSTITGLNAGTYYVTIVDAVGCTGNDTITINEPTPLNVTTQTTGILCNGNTDGEISVNVTGGTPPYTYSWNTGNTDSVLTALDSGYYFATITDVNGCILYDTAYISEPAPIIMNINTDSVSCVNGQDGRIQVTVTGGVAPYHYLWSGVTINDDSSTTINNLSAGTYYLTVTDQNSCESFTDITIYAYEKECLKIPDIFTPNGDGKNDKWEIDGINEYNDVHIEIYNRWGDIVFHFDGTGSEYDANRWNGTYNGKNLPFGSYMYIITLNNNKETYNGIVTIKR